MISTLDRIEAIRLIDEATTSGASLMRACKEIGITDRTYFRWSKLKRQTGSYEDLRPNSVHPEPANKLTAVEEQQILDVIKQAEFVDYPPCEIIPILAEYGAIDWTVEPHRLDSAVARIRQLRRRAWTPLKVVKLNLYVASVM